MIVSVHIPKTAGTSFRMGLERVFGARLVLDYGDAPEVAIPEIVARDATRRAELLAGVETFATRYDAVHGHFSARKYADLFPVTALVTLVRDPYQHAVSSFEHAARTTDSPHPAFRMFKDRRMTAVDLIEAVPDHQARYLDGVPLDEFAVVGLSEHYDRSVALFDAVFGLSTPRNAVRENANPTKSAGVYEIGPDIRRAVERHRAADVALYRRASERFAALCSAHGV